MWEYLKRVLENLARRFQLEYETAESSQYTQGNKSIQEYYINRINCSWNFGSSLNPFISISWSANCLQLQTHVPVSSFMNSDVWLHLGTIEGVFQCPWCCFCKSSQASELWCNWISVLCILVSRKLGFQASKIGCAPHRYKLICWFLPVNW